jgi:hypothetical protein
MRGRQLTLARRFTYALMLGNLALLGWNIVGLNGLDRARRQIHVLAEELRDASPEAHACGRMFPLPPAGPWPRFYDPDRVPAATRTQATARQSIPAVFSGSGASTNIIRSAATTRDGSTSRSYP